MKLEIGMYVRTKREGIGKIISLSIGEEDECCFIELSKRRTGIKEHNIVKASHNIIDLLQVGDIITFKEDEDVYKILQIPSKEWDFEDFYLVKNYDGETEDIFVQYEEMEKYIRSIVTKEQFESMSYKVEDK